MQASSWLMWAAPSLDVSMQADFSVSPRQCYLEYLET